MKIPIQLAYWAMRKRRFKEAAIALLPGRFGDAVHAYDLHRSTFGALPNRRRPLTMGDHLLRLKLSADGRSPLRARVTDKEFVKDYVAQKLGPGFTAETYTVLKTEDQIRGYDYPADCVIKATHDSGGVIIRRNSSPIDMAKLIQLFKSNYYWVKREPNYQHLQPKIIVEELLQQDGKDVPQDYKVFCFGGVPAFIQVDDDRFSGHKRTFFSTAWRVLPFLMNYPASAQVPGKPAGLSTMLDMSRKLSKDFSFVRVDFYQAGDRVVVGELTNVPEAGLVTFEPAGASVKLAGLFANPALDVERMF